MPGRLVTFAAWIRVWSLCMSLIKYSLAMILAGTLM